MNDIRGLSKSKRDDLYDELRRGTALLESHEQMCQYHWSFGNMHQAKLLDSFKQLDHRIFENEIEIIDWGCGQAMGTVNLFDYLNDKGLSSSIKKVTLIEPSENALEYAKSHVNCYLNDSIELKTFSEFFENINPSDISAAADRSVIHIFSNILDVAQINLKHLSRLIDQSVQSDNYLVCVGPLNPTNHRIDHFFDFFDDALIQKLYHFEQSNFEYSNRSKPCTYKSKIYKLERNEKGHLIPIEYYPPVQFISAYELDGIKKYRKEKEINSYQKIFSFEVAAPFDLGASVYDDVHPILAVLNNIIGRGVPTKSSLYIEKCFQKAFSLSSEKIQYGEISYQFNESEGIVFEELINTYLNQNNAIQKEDLIPLQLLLTPIAIARFHKVLLEAIINGCISVESESWKILVEEKDVPFAGIAIKDFEHTFNNLCQLSSEHSNLRFPKVELHVVSNESFFNSPLQIQGEVSSVVKNEWQHQQYDLVFTQSVLNTVTEDIEKFSRFKAKNNSYFNVLTSNKLRTKRKVYTSNLITYNDLVNKDRQGQFIENEKNKEALTYFLQLFFRKQAFRAGQLPILDRALKNLPVIGLLPTGGGKSLTYQIAALLQPGVTMIIDPLKSLMKDQYDGLVNSGIDCATYINSSNTTDERKERERQLEASELLFVFLSPERISIDSFRQRLKHMHDYNVYFSYGVIDEVHCVSEWGHDFRFSYLHLGRNLYNYVRAKEKEISLFGLTATASFDVLADVERELSGNGAFDLDADVIVRYENTNRLELQYKIERVLVQFEVDDFYDQHNRMDSSLPKALNITNTWSSFESKSDFLQKYITQLPTHLNELQTSENIETIKSEFAERQNNEEGIDLDLTIDISDNPFQKREEYQEAGIVFCPHVENTPLAVRENANNLQNNLVQDVASFSGRDNDTIAMNSLEAFRDNKSPLMVATKAFGMGIDKPNVRFTVNMNYSGSLEAFVQEAGRSGRDRKMALATILVSDYDVVQVSRKYNSNQHPIPTIRNKWFKKQDLGQILEHYNISIPEGYLLHATPDKDIVKLHCSKDNQMFAFNRCNTDCSEFSRCTLKRVDRATNVWMSEKELIQELKAQNLNITSKHFQYLNADYRAVMHFFNQSFKGDIIEKQFMVDLLHKNRMFIGVGKHNTGLVEKEGFLSSILSSDLDTEIVVYIPYSTHNVTDLSKAIYRMTCIELIEDFTQDYAKNQFRIITKNKAEEEYFNGLRRFLSRYYTKERAEKEITKVKAQKVRQEDIDATSKEIYQCLAYLTEFVYDKISEKRKRAIDDMRNFCMEGLDKSVSWLEGNERLKDFIYYYFNSKYAKSDYITDNGETFSLVEDTEGGKKSSKEILFKYLRVIDDDVVGIGTPLDNVKHLYGAVRLIGRSLTDSNPALYLLESFCLGYLGTKKNKSLEDQFFIRYSEGMIEFNKRIESKIDFWNLFEEYNQIMSSFIKESELNNMKEETRFLIHADTLKVIKEKYLEDYG